MSHAEPPERCHHLAYWDGCEIWGSALVPTSTSTFKAEHPCLERTFTALRLPTMNETTSPAPADHLPTPDERPQADVVIYDGDCRICTAQMHRLTWWDCQGHLAYLSLHASVVAERYPDLSHEMLMEQMVIVDRHGRRHGGAAALRRLSLRLRRLWWVAPLLYIPGSLPLWDFFYQQVARRRYRFGKVEPCEEETCKLHAHQETKNKL